MKKIILTAMIILAATSASAGQVRGYMKKNGTYVAPSYRSIPNNTRFDNYSTKGNYNPYNGKSGTVNPYKPYNPYKR